MKYHGFESPIDWSQYLIQKADKHEYEPSEPGKRVEALLEKLYLPQNSYSYAKFPQWFADAADKGTEEEQVRYVMNHLCPNLYHFYKNPTQKDFRLGPDVVNLMVHQHMCENTQATILNEDGSLFQDGVHICPVSLLPVHDSNVCPNPQLLGYRHDSPHLPVPHFSYLRTGKPDVESWRQAQQFLGGKHQEMHYRCSCRARSCICCLCTFHGQRPR